MKDETYVLSLVGHVKVRFLDCNRQSCYKKGHEMLVTGMVYTIPWGRGLRMLREGQRTENWRQLEPFFWCLGDCLGFEVF
jgi:hypothetical protein